MTNAYGKAGVDVHAGYEVVERIKKHVSKTQRLGMMGAIGGFGGLFDLSQLEYTEPVLVAGTDGVGTKLLVAIEADKHDTIGVDCVAMCVNDIVAQGAEPLFFLDYIATGKNQPAQIEQVVAGIARGCQQAGAGLIGGETAEMPGLYEVGEYDVAGFTVGVVEKSQLITGETIKAGDVLIGIASSGIHSNGYSLVRDIFFQRHELAVDEVMAELGGQRLVDVLLEPTKIYVNSLLPVAKTGKVKGMAHITGGGFVENIPRMLPEGLAANIKRGSWPILPIFEVLEKYGDILPDEMYEIFNMGIGMVMAVSLEDVVSVQKQLATLGEPSYVIGEVVKQTSQPIEWMEDAL
ncbi:phosphoribosylformylglycinamidine cyclo-ligase [Vagococcus xieshaowenii]|uniref:Phosphoribosylformylglycinamidine cyclo-ligase n=1 Tax=Vagococcus xieshaowenii TaxID=2562451 RepID=A0AAJ5JMC4_9ENTE|nr:phosphoribosylformylglycinamidine cyclo-ligase [Vagococcus xieshaowenii]QCA28803.1 phosphoribosylformylglycinamidine cyclo-ligase [Vagococcus xieshaowenii]TFZ42996.1 phosphoribosylformylglycinamidine cyclo-ligase [Vagococcus xieshaowenii]